MKTIIKILKNWGEYQSWRDIKKGKEPINMKRGMGYYFPTGLVGCNPVGREEEIKMQSGRTALIKLINYKLFCDPDDMIEESFWHMKGYKGEKMFKEMSFDEYLKSAFQK